jgi:hypothetical protein
LTAGAWDGPDPVALNKLEPPIGTDMLLPSSNFNTFEGRLTGSLESWAVLVCMFKYALLLRVDLSAFAASERPDDTERPDCYHNVC